MELRTFQLFSYHSTSVVGWRRFHPIQDLPSYFAAMEGYGQTNIIFAGLQDRD